MSKNMILERLEGVKKRFDEVGEELNKPEVMSDMKRYIRLNKEYKELEPVVKAYDEYRDLLSNIETAREMLAEEKDEEMEEQKEK